ncbi:MAG: CDP-alcohol phosphatidyltransferase family protein [Candidatus Bipolaricaulota bacterium]|nr:MAG: CDP-alcohol phosphatidyltransferase family protein [Candidatus Bipolaricaulota bacterium]
MAAMSLANRITLGRAALIPVAVVLLLTGNRIAAAVVFLLASAGDVLDGLVARARHEVTTLGKALDPAVDKALYLSTVCALAAVGELAIPLVVLFAVPQFAIGIGAWILHARVHVVQGARWFGKATAVLTFLSVLTLIAPVPDVAARGARIAFAVSVGLSYVATLNYGITALKAMRSPRSPAEGSPREP